MKRLYNCTARYDSETLVSYDTTIARKIDNIYILWYYPSSTSKMHLRKFCQKLAEDGYYCAAEIFENLYYVAQLHSRKHGNDMVAYNADTGEIVTGTNWDGVLSRISY